MIELNEEESKTLREALLLLHRKLPQAGEMSWKIDVGPVVFSPDDFVPFRQLHINGQSVKMRSVVQPPPKEPQL